jgi:transcriptional regulator with XRE-family HTH domain
MDMRMVVGLNVQRVRRERNFSQEELSFRSGFSRAYLSGLEAGKRNPTIMSLWKLAVALDVTLEDLVRRSGKGGERQRPAAD